MTYSAFLDILFAMYVVGITLAVIYFCRVLHPRRYQVVTTRMAIESMRAAKALRLVEKQRQQSELSQ